MGCRSCLALGLAGAFAVTSLGGLVDATPSAQDRRAPQSADERSTLRTADGRPDLSGVWNFASGTPLERPEEFGNRAVLTDEELAQIVRRAEAEQQAGDRQPPAGDTGSYNLFWTEIGTRRGDPRTSLISDPPDGRLPPVTPDTQKRMLALMTAESDPEKPEDLTPWGRCLTGFNAGPPILPSGYSNVVQVFQTPDAVVLFTEMVHEARYVPLDGRPHLSPVIRQWQGDSRGRWEGDTLVIDTRHFRSEGTGNLPLLGAGVGGKLRSGVLTDENLHVVERLSRPDATTLRYEVTVEDPTVWTRPWTAAVLMQKTRDNVYEYACHEGNYSMQNILVGQRAAKAKP
jgi:hypothetical protein